MGKKTGRTNVPADVFVRTCREVLAEGGNHEDIRSRLNMSSTGVVASRICGLRKQGVEIPQFPRGGGGGRRLDVAGLNAILAE